MRLVVSPALLGDLYCFIKDRLGLECKYSAELTEEQIEGINSTVVESGDWALISLLPFDTAEMLTVTMKSGESFTIQVTDAQLKKTVMTASGETYEITVTYDETAGIPEGADLNVSELTEDNSEYASYMERAADTVDAEVTDISYAKFLDISIVDESGKKVVPGALVDVKIKLLDKNNEGEGAEEVTQIVHFAEKKDTVEPELLDNTAEGSTVAFRTDGFSVYAIVSGPLDNPAGGWHSAISGSEIEDLMSEGVSLYTLNSHFLGLTTSCQQPEPQLFSV